MVSGVGKFHRKGTEKASEKQAMLIKEQKRFIDVDVFNNERGRI